MKKHKLSKTQQAVIAPETTSTGGRAPDEINFTPAPDEVARRAYFAYENHGSQPGHEVQHWLAAESELIAKRNQTRVHGFHNKA
ncbi:MAG: DUF2934 domain-containing protein [Verrucomicrobiota bacterium]